MVWNAKSGSNRIVDIYIIISYNLQLQMLGVQQHFLGMLTLKGKNDRNPSALIEWNNQSACGYKNLPKIVSFLKLIKVAAVIVM